jgi:hypothetical protein
LFRLTELLQCLSFFLTEVSWFPLACALGSGYLALGFHRIWDDSQLCILGFPKQLRYINNIQHTCQQLF